MPYYTHSCAACGDTFCSSTGLWMHLTKTNHSEETRGMAFTARSYSGKYHGHESSSPLSSDNDDINKSYSMHYDDTEGCNLEMDDNDNPQRLGDVNSNYNVCHGRRLSSIPSGHPGCRDVFDGAGKSYGRGENTFSQMWNADACCRMREKNPYYPFSCKMDFDVARWIMESALPTRKVGELLDLNYVSRDCNPCRDIASVCCR